MPTHRCRGARVCGEMPQHRNNSTVLRARVKNKQPRKAWHSHKTYRQPSKREPSRARRSRNVGGGHTCRVQPHDSKECLSLFATEIALCCLDGHMAQQELDLFQFTSSRVTESSA